MRTTTWVILSHCARINCPSDFIDGLHRFDDHPTTSGFLTLTHSLTHSQLLSLSWQKHCWICRTLSLGNECSPSEGFWKAASWSLLVTLPASKSIFLVEALVFSWVRDWTKPDSKLTWEFVASRTVPGNLKRNLHDIWCFILIFFLLVAYIFFKVASERTINEQYSKIPSYRLSL